jgi:hypothetical protein
MADDATRKALLDRPLTGLQLARFLQVSPSTLRRQMRTDPLPFIVIGGERRFLARQVLRHLNQKQRTGRARR